MRLACLDTHAFQWTECLIFLVAFRNAKSIFGKTKICMFSNKYLYYLYISYIYLLYFIYTSSIVKGKDLTDLRIITNSVLVECGNTFLIVVTCNFAFKFSLYKNISIFKQCENALYIIGLYTCIMHIYILLHQYEAFIKVDLCEKAPDSVQESSE